MAHWAELDENNVVVRVVVGNNDEQDEGYQWLIDNLGGRWIKTSYNTQGGVHLLGGEPFRGNFAATGFTYDENLDAFIPPQEFPSWTLNQETFQWEPPVSYPATGGPYVWNEENQDWQSFSEA